MPICELWFYLLEGLGRSRSIYGTHDVNDLNERNMT